MKKKSNEKKMAAEVREACEKAFDEQHSHNPKAAAAFLALGRMVPRVANAVPGWSGLTRPFFARKGVH